MDKCYFKVPNEKDQQSALGSLAGEKFSVKKCLQAIVPLFKSIPEPKILDWLFSHQEYGQPYEIYKNNSSINWFEEKRNTIYIFKLEANISQEFSQLIKKFCKVFYLGAKVKVRIDINLNNLQVEHRINEYTEKIQYKSSQILRQLEQHVPNDAYCVIGVMASDLYPQDDWNFVFGQASYKSRVGVFSLARYNENFFLQPNQQPLQPIDQNLITKRGVKVMIHEIGHMFGLQHCIYYSCLMNGCNNQQESDNQPMWICPVCLRKLQANLKFDIEQWSLLKKEKADFIIINKMFSAFGGALTAFLRIDPMNCILDPEGENEEKGGMYLGNIYAAFSEELLKKHKIGAVLTVAADTGLSYKDKLHLIIPAEDVESYDLSKYFDKMIEFIEDCRKSTNILVHCFAGVSRSATAVCAYLMKKNQWDYPRAYAYCKKKRFVASPNPGFVRQLRAFDRKNRPKINATAQKGVPNVLQNGELGQLRSFSSTGKQIDQLKVKARLVNPKSTSKTSNTNIHINQSLTPTNGSTSTQLPQISVQKPFYLSNPNGQGLKPKIQSNIKKVETKPLTQKKLNVEKFQ